ncbi:MopE-related protein [Seonamhaeicola maritimus]|uniref:MopE-related protein n=1 Tax=Seonamhaeicola maritimus TaxID=2591822 RepID=UPI0024953A52|nr:MopE-related protein [Seonamhaeicola maritimus]
MKTLTLKICVLLFTFFICLLQAQTPEVCDGIDNDGDGLIDEIEGNAFSFDGIDDRLEIPHNDILNIDVNETFTIELWLKRTGVGDLNWPHIFGKRIGCGGGDLNYQLLYNYAQESFYFVGKNGQGVQASTPFPLNEWLHFAATSDGTTCYIYINGCLISSLSSNSVIGATDTGSLVLGNAGTCSHPYVGLIDEYRFWSVQRTEHEINDNLLKKLIPAEEPNLLLYLPFDQGIAGGDNTSITQVEDVTSSNLNGNILNMTMNGTSSNFIESGNNVGSTRVYLDSDGDGFGDVTNSLHVCCDAPSDYVTNSDDCDDSEESIYPGAEELCDGLDNDCDGVVDENCDNVPPTFIDPNDLNLTSEEGADCQLGVSGLEEGIIESGATFQVGGMNQIAPVLVGHPATESGQFSDELSATCANIIFGPIINPANGHTYLMLDHSTWSDAEAMANTLGGHLVAINDADENNYVISNFLNRQGVESVWIGLSDIETEGVYEWTNGDPVTFTGWGSGEPNDGLSCGTEDVVHIWNPGWNDCKNDICACGQPFDYHYGVVEIASDSFNCDDPTLSLVSIEESGDSCAREYTLLWEVKDTSGNATQQDQVFTVVDYTAPETPEPPEDMSYQCVQDVPEPSNMVALDNCHDEISVLGVDSDNEGEGSAASPLVITRTWEFDDGCGNTSSINQTITVIDTTNPELTSVQNFTEKVDENCELIIPDYTSLTEAADNCSTPEVTQSPDVGTIISGHEFVQTITLIANDGFGNSSSINFDITLIAELSFYEDLDGDGFGNSEVATIHCTAPVGYVDNDEDCDDNDADNYPGNTEVCDGKDNNCDGEIDEGVTNTFYADNDGDGYGNNQQSVTACNVPDGYVEDNTDCDDTNPNVNPNANEVVGNGIDDDCDPTTSDDDECLLDDDNDGIVNCEDECPNDSTNTCNDNSCGKHKVWVCHETGNGRTIQLCLPKDQLQGHLGHGDTAEKCEDSKERKRFNGFKFWPNPSKHNFNIRLNSGKLKNDKALIYVYDITGKLVHKNNFKVDEIYMFGNQLESGLYIIKLELENYQEIIRLVKSNY